MERNEKIIRIEAEIKIRLADKAEIKKDCRNDPVFYAVEGKNEIAELAAEVRKLNSEINRIRYFESKPLRATRIEYDKYGRPFHARTK